jgi:hypothetical protein
MKRNIFWSLPFFLLFQITIVSLSPINSDSEFFFWVFNPLCILLGVFVWLSPVSAVLKALIVFGFTSSVALITYNFFDFLSEEPSISGIDRSPILLFSAVLFFLALAVLLSAVMVTKQPEGGIGAVDWLKDVSIGPKSMSRAVAELDVESDRMRGVAFLSIVGVGVLIVSAVFVFLFAGIITSIDLSGADPNASITKEIEFLNSANRDSVGTREELIRQKERLLVEAGSLAPNATAESISKIQEDVAVTTDRLNRLEREYTRNLGKLARLEAVLLKNLEDISANSLSKPQDVSALIASAVTRFGVIVIIMYFAQSLIGLYRYTLRVSASLKTKGIALALASGNQDSLDFFAKFASTDHIGLGREARSTMEEIAKLAELIKSMRPTAT